MPSKYDAARELLEALEAKGITFWREGDKIKYKAGAGAMQKDDILRLKACKSEILELLAADSGKVKLMENKSERYEPFVLTDVQQSYLMGRGNLFDYGGVACHIYIQLCYEQLDTVRVERVWNELIAKHEMLRAVIHEEGYQQIMKEAPPFNVRDYGDLPADQIEQEMGHDAFEIGSWPYFAVGVSNYEKKAIMHISIEFIIADWTSIWMLMYQFEQLYFGELQEIQSVPISFRDYVLTEREQKESAVYAQDKAYWMKQLETFPTRPLLPVIRSNDKEKAYFERKYVRLSPDEWGRVKQYALVNGITPTTLVLMLYAAALERYSENKRFAINLTVLNRQPFHPDIDKVIGDFTTLSLLEIDFGSGKDFLETAKITGERLFGNMDHSSYSGVEFMREISRSKGPDAAFMPYVFTSAVGLFSSMPDMMIRGMGEGSGISQTPQVFIDCQVMDGNFGMQVNWDIRKGVFEPCIIEDMFTLFREMLCSIVDGMPVIPDHPAYQAQLLADVNRTAQKLPTPLLHENILRAAAEYPDKTAVISGRNTYTYSQLLCIAGGILQKLKTLSPLREEPIGIAAEKSVYQPAGALAILCAGCAYVPISVEQGTQRIESILRRSGIRIILTTTQDNTPYPEDITVIRADTLSECKLEPEVLQDRSDSELAYIIFTSGSTGEPKGVAISHAGAVNTIEDINRRYNVTEKDSVLGVSQLSFDLSVYDIFGVLGTGGTLVYPEDERKKEPAHLAQLIAQHHITLWNSVPSLLRMVMVYLASETKTTEIESLRLVLLSGDWIPLDLPDTLMRYAPDAQVVSLGGATEASIWSNYHDYHGLCSNFRSIPYGRPLANQEFRVLDEHLRNCPVGVKGDLYILGKGLAQGYYRDPERTQKQFFIHPITGERMYRTGDVGMYHHNGEIEFLGRSDDQIKLNGHRIELGEIESAVSRTPGIARNIVVYTDVDGEKALTCYYETAVADEAKRTAYTDEWNAMTADFQHDPSFDLCVLEFVKKYAALNAAARILIIGDEEFAGHLADELPDIHITQWVADISEQADTNAFDIVISRGGFAGDVRAAVRTVRSCLRPGGYFLTRDEASYTLLDEIDNSNTGGLLNTECFAMQCKTDRYNVTVKEILDTIRDRLTTYMIPTAFCMLDNIPVTFNGKTDMRALAALAAARKHSKAGTAALSSETDHMTDLQKQLAEIIEQSGIHGAGLTDNFYDLGADSLMMAQLTGNLRKSVAQAIPFDELLRFLLNHPTLGQLSVFLADK